MIYSRFLIIFVVAKLFYFYVNKVKYESFLFVSFVVVFWLLALLRCTHCTLVLNQEAFKWL